MMTINGESLVRLLVVVVMLFGVAHGWAFNLRNKHPEFVPPSPTHTGEAPSTMEIDNVDKDPSPYGGLGEIGPFRTYDPVNYPEVVGPPKNTAPRFAQTSPDVVPTRKSFLVEETPVDKDFLLGTKTRSFANTRREDKGYNEMAREIELVGGDY